MPRAETSFRVRPGESFGIVSESVSGKSTVLRAICGLAPRSAGTIAPSQDAGGPAPALEEPGSTAFRRLLRMVFQDTYGSLHLRQTVATSWLSHDLAVVTHLCERLMVMQRGQTVEFLSASDLAARRVTNDYTHSLMKASGGFKRAAGPGHLEPLW